MKAADNSLHCFGLCCIVSCSELFLIFILQNEKNPGILVLSEKTGASDVLFSSEAGYPVSALKFIIHGRSAGESIFIKKQQRAEKRECEKNGLFLVFQEFC